MARSMHRRVAMTVLMLLSSAALSAAPSASAAPSSVADYDPCSGEAVTKRLLTIGPNLVGGPRQTVRFNCGQEEGEGVSWGLRHIVAGHAKLPTEQDFENLKTCVTLLATDWRGYVKEDSDWVFRRVNRDGVTWRMVVRDTTVNDRGVITIFAQGEDNEKLNWNQCA
ncbi:hypothetical protein [Actinophytocola oryzae]|uniref:Secreted protein n=1 Tax=Actinophytocola oryzae TaxID=502181 RepID=A0A4R7URS2_9PSEU|nr:hypothetical protein [Actinophytocola oryzae]TDV37748.1 hypothetical protein CLV71_12812 [Actinophytocola oryzae]